MASVQTVGENNCIVNMANRLTDEECAKKQRKFRGGGCWPICLFNSEWARTFPGIRASNQSAAKAYCVASRAICILVSATAEDTM